MLCGGFWKAPVGYSLLATFMIARQMSWRTVLPALPFKRMRDSEVLPETLPTQVAVATEVEVPVIQVCTPESVVPVLPASIAPSPVFDAPPVPPAITRFIA